MMGLIVETTGSELNNKYYEGIYNVGHFLPNHKWKFIDNDPFNVDQSDLENKFFLGSERKVYVWVQTAFYHLLIDTLAPIILEYRQDSSTLFILNMVNTPTKGQTLYDEPYMKFFFKILDDYGVNYVILNGDNTKDLYIRDFYHIDGAVFSKKLIDNFKDFSSIYFDKDAVPHKKVYLSRRKAPKRSAPRIKPGLDFEHDERVLNEELVEKYFQKHGFEIVFPEDFNSFEDQIKYFNSVKVVASSTSASILNAIFMQPGTTIMEMLVPLTVILTEEGDAFQQLHVFYPQIAYSVGLTYVAVPHDRNPLKIIQTIEENKYLQVLINE